MDRAHRAGWYIQQGTGYKAFVPASLPPDPPLAYGGEVQTLLSAADRDIGRLDALAAHRLDERGVLTLSAVS